MNLVIVESPAKCSKIQGFLGPTYKVIATMGHIRALEEDIDAVGITRDFNLRYEFLKDKARAIQGMKSAAEGATTIYLASDDDREGEAIAYSVCVLLGLDPNTTHRAVFHEITKGAIQAAVASPRKLDMNRVNAQQARAALDMMIGFTISPLLWKHVMKGASAGRCQTPALRLIVDRETDIESHVTESSWAITGTWSAPGTFKPFKFNARFTGDMKDEDAVRAYIDTIISNPVHTITAASLTEWKQVAPAPFITSTLQQAASSYLKSSPKKTMAAAQKLYEAGHITYMRTDSAILSDDAKEECRAIVRSKWGDEYVCGGGGGSQTPVSKKGAKAKAKTQDAHEAIRPTHFAVEDIPGDWTLTEKKLYKMIWLRTIQSTMADVKGEQKIADFSGWKASWRRTTFPGWRRAGEDAANAADEDGTDATEAITPEHEWSAATTLNVGVEVSWDSLVAKPVETAPPKRYTEATLIKMLEKSGIGRPSTFASLVETIRDKNYVEVKDIEGMRREVPVLAVSRDSGGDTPIRTIQEKVVGGEARKLVPTELGRQVLKFCLGNFATLFDYTFTSKMEERLDLISKGEEDWKEVLRDTWGGAGGLGRVAAIQTNAETKSSPTKKVFPNGLVAIIRKTGQPLLLKEAVGDGKPVFYGWPEGVTFSDMTEERAREFVAKGPKGAPATAIPSAGGDVLGHWNGVPILKKRGKFGTYLVCGDVNISCNSDITLEGAIEKFKEKAQMKVRIIGGYELRETEKGAYMFKKTLKTKKFVKIPGGLDIMKLSASEADAIYKTGTGDTPAPNAATNAAPKLKQKKYKE